MQDPSRAPYQDRIFRVIDYIYANPAADLSLDELADVAAMSRFHWHRVFRAVTGETLAEAVRRIRMGRAAYWLIAKDWPMPQIARACGYPLVPSFTRTFTESYGLSPAAYRKRGALLPLAAPDASLFSQGDQSMYPVTIFDLPARRLAALPHSGPYHDIGQAFDKASAVFSTRNLWAEAKGTIGVYPDDPSAIPEADLRSFAGIIVDEAFEIPAPLQEVQVPAGRHAVMTVKGPYAGLSAAYDWLYRQWLPGSGQDVGEHPVFEHYLNAPADTPPEELLTEVCLPLRA